jgi:hypothetical protein
MSLLRTAKLPMLFVTLGILGCSLLGGSPEVPQGLSLTLDPGSADLTATWNSVEGCSYTVQCYVDGVGWVDVGTNVTTTTYTSQISNIETNLGLSWVGGSPSKDYYVKVRVKAISDGRPSDWSDEAAVVLHFEYQVISQSLVTLGGGQYQAKVTLKNLGNTKVIAKQFVFNLLIDDDPADNTYITVGGKSLAVSGEYLPGQTQEITTDVFTYSYPGINAVQPVYMTTSLR